MGQLVVAAAGAAIGFAVAGPAGAKWGWALGSMAGGALLAEDVEGPRLGDLRVTGTEYGATIPWVAGSPRIAGQIVWASPKRETANTQSAKGGPEQTTYTYDCDLLILLTENEIAGVSRIWLNSELVYGAGTTKSGVWGGITVYTGAADQLPDPTYEAAVGVGNAPAYRGRAYVVITGLQLGNSGQIPNLTFELAEAAGQEIQPNFYAPYSTNAEDVVAPTYPSYYVVENSDYPDEYITYTENGVSFTRESTAVWFINNLIYGPTDPVDTKLSLHSEDYLSSASAVLEFSIEAFDAPPTLGGIGSEATIFVYSNSTTFGHNHAVHFQLKKTSQTNWDLICKIGPNTSTYYYSGVVGEVSGLLGASIYIVANLQDETTAIYIGQSLVVKWPSDPVRTDYYRLNFGFVGSGGLSASDQMTRLDFGFIKVYGQETSTGAPNPILEFINLPQVASELFIRAGYSASDADVSDLSLDDIVRAFAISNVSSTRSALDVLKSAYFFEASTSDRIYIRPRSTTPVATISYAELGAGTDAGGSDQAFELTKSNDLEVPAQIALSYANMAGDYNSATEYSDRVLSQQETISGVQLPLGLLPAEAKAIADSLIIDAASSVVRATLRVPLRYAYIEPGDVFNAVNDDGRTYRLRVQTKRDSLTLIELECVLDDVGALDSAAVTDAGYTEAAVVQVAASEFEALDIPILRDADNGPGYYIGVAPDVQTDPYEWKGALVARSWDDVSYSELFQATTASVMGACSTTLGDWTGGNVWDESNTLTVVTTGGELASSTKAAMQLDPTLNVAAIGSQAAGWEIVRFVNATLTAANTYVLSGFHRGFRGTEWRMASHGAGEQFVLLNAGVGHVASQTNQIGLERHIKAVTFGLLLSSATSEAFTDTGVALKPFSPANPVALASGSDLVVTWQRRTRVSYTYLGATPTVPLGESTEQYRVRIYDGATLVRTDTVATPTYTYTAANLTSDGFASTDPVTFEICQVSEIVGAGYPATIQGTAP